jgi:hypothetical protein
MLTIPERLASLDRAHALAAAGWHFVPGLVDHMEVILWALTVFCAIASFHFGMRAHYTRKDEQEKHRKEIADILAECEHEKERIASEVRQSGDLWKDNYEKLQPEAIKYATELEKSRSEVIRLKSELAKKNATS